ncbi:MAG: L-glutamate gamma-semialdehyde dehydrogenase [Bdellovibrionota bacterium]
MALKHNDTNNLWRDNIMTQGKFAAPLPKNEAVLGYAPGSTEKKLIKEELKRQSNQVVDIPLVIGGKHILDRQIEELHSPHSKNLTLAKVRTATEEDVHNAIASSLNARKEWANLAWEERAAVFLKAADLLSTKYRAKLNAATMLGQSKTVFQAEIDAACELIDFFRFNVYYLQKILEEQPMYSPFGQWNRSSVRGLEGFVFAIAPFNFTSISLNLACAPALMGCSVLWKPAHTSALSSYIGMQLLEEAGLPPGVINFINGDPEMIGKIALNHKDLSGIHFTGSSATFNHIWHQVGTNIQNYKSFPRLVGETGGKDFIFAHPSADIDSLVTALVRGAFEYQGQKCSAASRAYIPASMWPELKSKLIPTTQELKMGDPSDFTNFVSAVIDQRAFNKIKSFIDHAQSSKEAEIICGGECDDSNGFFIRPTIIMANSPSYKSMVEEIFGPVLTIYVYEDKKLEETIAICDSSTPYALTGAIFAKDRHAISELTQKLEHSAGNFYINDKPTGAVVGQQPFGGGRASGTNDKAGSMFNLLRWVSHRTIKENFLQITDYRYPFMEQE